MNTAAIETPFAHLNPILNAIALTNEHDAYVRALSIDPSRSVALLAPAGSGKTTQLLYRMMACLTVVEAPEHILAITFTNKAAGEIVERVTGALAQAAMGAEPEASFEKPLYMLSRLVLERDKALGWNLLLNPSRLRIMTFDAYCARLAAKMPIMSGYGGGRTAEDPSLIYRAAVLDTLGSVNDPSIPDELREALESVLSLAKNQFEALVPLFSNLLEKRDQWVGEVMAMSPKLMSEALNDLVASSHSAACNVLDRHGFNQCWSILQRASQANPEFAWAAYGQPDLTERGLSFARAAAKKMLKTDGAIRTKVTAREGFPAKEPLTVAMNAFLAGLSGDEEINEALHTLATLPDTEYPERSAQMLGHLVIVLRYLLANLMLAFDAQASVDFPEVAQRAIQSLGASSEVGEALLDEDRIRHLLIDENQDTSRAQYQLLERIVEEWEPDDERSIFMCGDQSQSIYLFRGATLQQFTDTVSAGQFGPKQLDVLHLTVNFRSAPVVVDWNNVVYGKLFQKAAGAFVPSVPHRSYAGQVSVESTDSEDDEAQRVVELVRAAFADDPQQSVAILVRGRSHLKSILPALKAAGITASGTDIDPIAKSPAISEVVSLIRALWHQADRTAWLAVLRASFVGLSWADCLVVARGHAVIPCALRLPEVHRALSLEGQQRVRRLLDTLDAVQQASRSDELSWRARAAWVSLGGMATVDKTELGDAKTVFGLLDDHTATGDLEDSTSFFNKLDRLFATPKAGSVQIMTVHKSKGLEFGCVIVPGLHRTSVPDEKPLFHWRRMNGRFFLAPNIGDQDEGSVDSRLFAFVGGFVKKDLSDEVDRLCYVATTRAKMRLHLLACWSRDDDKAPPKTSMLGRLWPAIADELKLIASTGAAPAPKPAVPSKARLGAGYAVTVPGDAFMPASLNDQLPTEEELHEEIVEEEGDDYRAQIEGIVYHRVVELIAKDGLDLWDEERVQGKAQAIAALMRREGYPIREVPAGRDRIIRLVLTTIRSEKGRWILSKHEQGGQEVQLTGYRNGRWMHRYLDRPFVSGGAYWITDWKTPECPEGMPVETFLRRIAARYSDKMNEYRQIAKEAGITLPVKLGLYLPAVDRFVEL